MKKNLIAVILVGAVILAAALIAPVFGYPGGTGNKNLQANSCSDHDIVSSSNTVSVSASKLSPAPGEQITVTASLSGTGGSGNKAGIALFTALSGSSGTAPTDKGWVIVSDPSGTTYNYNEKSYSGSASFAWTMKAPATAGTYSIYARAYMGPTFNYKDAASPLTFTVASATVINPPTVQVTAPSSGASVSGTFSVAATAAPGTGATISSVELRIDSTSVGTKTASPYSWSVNSASYTNGAHTVNITATDNGGRKGFVQSGITVNNVAQLPPAVSITAPASGSTLTGTATIAATATPSGTASISSVALSVDGVPVGTKTASPYTWSLNTVIYANGTHTILVTATDSSAKQGTAQTSVTVSNDPPVNMDNSTPNVVVTSPLDNSTVFGNATVAVTILGPNPIRSVAFYLDSAEPVNLTASPYVWNFDSRTLSNGLHHVTVKAIDSNGKSNTSYLRLTVNNSGPIITVDSPLDGSNVTGTVSVSVGVISLQPVGNVTLLLDGNVVSSLNATPYAWLWDTGNSTVGAHALQVSAVDSNGNVNYHNLTVNVPSGTVTIDLTLPDVESGIFDLTPTITSKEPIKNVLYILDGNVTGNVTGAPFAYSMDSTTVADGAHKLNVTAVTVSGLKWFKEFPLTIVNDIGGSSSGGSDPDLHLSAVDLLILQALLVITVLAVALKFSHKGKRLNKGLWSKKEGKEPIEGKIDPEATVEEK